MTDILETAGDPGSFGADWTPLDEWAVPPELVVDNSISLITYESFTVAQLKLVLAKLQGNGVQAAWFANFSVSLPPPAE